MSGLIHEHAYAAIADKVAKKSPVLASFLDALEWELTNQTDFSSYTPLPPVHGDSAYAYKTSLHAGETFILMFTVEENGGTKKVVLRDLLVG